MPKEELKKFVRKFAQSIIGKELVQNETDPLLYTIKLDDQDYINLEQEITNFLLAYQTRILN